jgi:hypothetical protein
MQAAVVFMHVLTLHTSLCTLYYATVLHQVEPLLHMMQQSGHRIVIAGHSLGMYSLRNIYAYTLLNFIEH